MNILFFILGLAIGGALIWFLRQREINSSKDNTSQLKDVFGNLSREALKENQETFLDLAKSQFEGLLKTSDGQLEEKKKLIDSNIESMKARLDRLAQQTSSLKGQVEQSDKGIAQLTTTTGHLREILSSSQARGQWGEKMVEDILNFMGLMEGINFKKQSQEGSGRPDFTFILPHKKRINMDVKFPWSHYAALFTTESDTVKEQEKKQFFADVKNHIKVIAKREYIDPASGTLDYVLMFIPNEGIYAYLNKEGNGLIDFALTNKVVLCSPITLYAVLSMVRQSVENFKMEARAGEMQMLVQVFKEQWTKFVEKIGALGKTLETVQNHYDELSTTRVRQLDKPIEKILELNIEEPSEAKKLEEKVSL